MAVLKSLLAIVAGYAAIAALVIGGTFLLARLMVPQGAAPDLPYLIANMSASFLAAVAGGSVTAKLAPQRPGLHGAGLAMLVGALGVVAAAGHPVSLYAILLPALGVIGVAVGVLLCRVAR